jgi:hypothetical protein
MLNPSTEITINGWRLNLIAKTTFRTPTAMSSRSRYRKAPGVPSKNHPNRATLSKPDPARKANRVRGAHTSRSSTAHSVVEEVLSSTGLVLRRLRDSGEINDVALLEEVELVLDKGTQLWNGRPL